MVDCDYHDYRCEGGYYNYAFHFLADDQGLEATKRYPYKVDNNLNCFYDPEYGVALVKEWKSIKNDEK